MSRQRVLPSQSQQQQRGPPPPQDGPLYNNGPGAPMQPASQAPGPQARQQQQQQYYPEHDEGMSGGMPAARPPSASANGYPAASPPSGSSGRPGTSSRREREPSAGASAASMLPASSSGSSSRRAPAFEIDEEAILKEYGLSSLQPTEWEDTNPPVENPLAIPGVAESASARPAASRARSTFTGKGAAPLPDEPDPLGLYRGTVLSNIPTLPPEVVSTILLSSKTFSPTAFINNVHPAAGPDDLAYGRERLQEAAKGRESAIQRLVEDNFDRFIGIKAASGIVYDEMKLGPLSKEADYSVGDLKEALKAAQAKADAVWNPILEARLKADRLRSTLGIFERSKFFFTLPGVLSEAVSAGRYDAALSAYKKGKYLLDSRPGALLGLPPGTTMTEQQGEKHRRVFEKVWGQVERTMSDLRTMLGKRLRDPKRSLEEVEKTIEILLELDPTGEPVWIYFDTQHHHIMQALRYSHANSTTKFNSVLKKLVSPASTEDAARSADLKAGVLALESPGQDSILEKGSGQEVWKSLAEVVHNLSEILLQTLPNFWKVAKGYMEGRYQRKDPHDRKKQGHRDHHQDKNHTGRRSSSQIKVMLNEIINLYIALLSDFFTLSSATHQVSPKLHGDGTGNVLAPLPGFVPANSNALTAGVHLLRSLSELTDATNDIGALAAIGSEVQGNLREFLLAVRFRFLESVCGLWVRDAKLFWRLEDWSLDSEELSRTVYLARMERYMRGAARLAYRASGGSEERAGNLFMEAKSGVALLRRMGNDNIPTDFARRIHTTYLDALYDFLDGLVHVAFVENAPRPPALPPRTVVADATLPTGDINGNGTEPVSPGKAKQVDVRDRDVRILLTVSNLSHFRTEIIPRIADQLQTALKIDMGSDSKTLNDVVGQLDKILFDDYIKGRSVALAATIEKGVLGNGIDWHRAPKPTAVHPYIYDALLSLVLVHAQVTAIARSLVTRTIGALVQEVAKHALACFSQVASFGMGGMLQATLEMEFLHQTLNTHVSSGADATLQEIYKIISAKYRPGGPPGEGAGELQAELEQLKLTLTQARRATALQFLCFRERKAAVSQAAGSGSAPAASSGVGQGGGAPSRR